MTMWENPLTAENLPDITYVKRIGSADPNNIISEDSGDIPFFGSTMLLVVSCDHNTSSDEDNYVSGICGGPIHINSQGDYMFTQQIGFLRANPGRPALYFSRAFANKLRFHWGCASQETWDTLYADTPHPKTPTADVVHFDLYSVNSAVTRSAGCLGSAGHPDDSERWLIWGTQQAVAAKGTFVTKLGRTYSGPATFYLSAGTAKIDFWTLWYEGDFKGESKIGTSLNFDEPGFYNVDIPSSVMRMTLSNDTDAEIKVDYSLTAREFNF